jgi:hypothetical protein
MCLAIYQPKGKEVPEKHLKNGFENHGDGCGIAWAEDGKLKVKKGVGMKFEEFLEWYNQVKQFPCLIHFRKSTSGKIDEANCHPFIFNEGKLAAIHNGVLNIKCNDKDFSDTYHFVTLVLDPIIRKYHIPVNDGSLNYLICTSIGSDKLAVMDGNGKTYIFNEEKGTWDEGVWYSNNSFKWAYTTTTSFGGSSSTFHRGVYSTSPYFNGNCQSAASDTEDENDEAYLEFWRRQTSPASNVCATAAQQTTLLLNPPAGAKADSGRTAIDIEGTGVDIEGQMDEGDPDRPKDKKKIGPGMMAEYGWFDAEVEHEIENCQLTLGFSRDEAMIRVFLDK